MLAALLVLACLLAVACSDSESADATATPEPSPTYTGPGTLYTIEATTQLHLDGVAIGAGNIWEEEYTPAGGTSRRGLTAGLFITVEDDVSQNQNLRVHPGQKVIVPDYQIQVLSVEPQSVNLAIEDVPD